MNTKIAKRLKRKTRIRVKVFGNTDRPRLSFYKSNRHVFAQVIDDEKGITLASAGDIELSKGKDDKKVKKTNGDKYFEIGELIASKATKKKVQKVVFDRGGYKFHGLITKFVEGARKGGLNF